MHPPRHVRIQQHPETALVGDSSGHQARFIGVQRAMESRSHERRERALDEPLQGRAWSRYPGGHADREQRWSYGAPGDINSRRRDRVVFTTMSQDSISEAIAPGGSETIHVEKRYDAEGNLTYLSRASSPVDVNGIGAIITQWRYDNANRRIVEISPDGSTDTTYYDPSGNVVRSASRRPNPSTPSVRLAVSMAYDSLDRLRTRVRDGFTYPQRNTGFSSTRRTAISMSTTTLHSRFRPTRTASPTMQ